MRNLITITATFFITMHSTNLISAQEAAIKSDEMIVFLENRDSIANYGCAVFVESDTDANKIDLASFQQDWHLHCFHGPSRKRRIDTISLSDLKLSSGAVKELPNDLITFFSETETVQYYGNRRQTIDIAKATDVDKASMLKQVYFDPVTVSCVGQSAMKPRDVYSDPGDIYRRIVDRYKMTNVELNGMVTKVEYRVSDKFPIFDVIFFDRRQGEMPVVVNRERRDSGNRESTKIENSSTNWISKNDRWYPHEATLKLDYGNGTKSWKLKYYWWVENVSDLIFDTAEKKTIYSNDLKEMIVAECFNRR